jgi:hypothetical protein
MRRSSWGTRTRSELVADPAQEGGLIWLEFDMLDGRMMPPNTPLELVGMVRAEMDRLRWFHDHLCEGQDL